MKTMKAVRMHAFGDVDVLHYEEVERPVPQAGEVLVQVRAAGYGMPRFPGEAKAYSEYTAVPVSDLARKPERLTYQEAAAVPMAALSAW